MKRVFIFFGLIFAAWIYCLADSSDGLILWYTMDNNDINGTAVFDKSGYGFTGGLSNGTTVVSGVVREGLSFDGAANWVKIGVLPQLDLTNDMAVTAWIKTSNTASQTIIGKHSSSSAGWWFYINSGVLVFDGMNYTCNSSGIVTNGAWTHVGFSRSLTNITFYVNGVFDSMTVRTGINTGAVTRAATIGKRADTASLYFNGRMDDMRVYNRALKAGEVKDLFSRSKRAYICQ